MSVAVKWDLSDVSPDSEDRTPFTCPVCGGSLQEGGVPDLRRYGCFAGHRFTERQLEEAQRKSAEATLWAAHRILRERELLLLKMATPRGEAVVDSRLSHAAASARRCATRLLALIQRTCS